MRSLVLLVALGATFATSAQAAGREAKPATGEDARFAQHAESLLDRLWKQDPESAFQEGYYKYSDRLEVPDAASRAARLKLDEDALATLRGFDERNLSPANRVDLVLLRNQFESDVWYVKVFRDWQWQPSQYNVGDSFGRQLTTEYAPLEKRLRDMLARLGKVPAYYAAARKNIDNPTLEYTELALEQNNGALGVFGDDLLKTVEGSKLTNAEKVLFKRRVAAARTAIQGYVDFLTDLAAKLKQGGARSFRIGKELYAQKYAFDLQSGYTAEQLYEKALAEKASMLDRMEKASRDLWPKYLGDKLMPADRLDLIGAVIGELSRHHTTPDKFVETIRNQLPELERFVREHDLVDQDASRPLLVRETPLYLRGFAGAGINAPGPYDPTARTYYNVTPLDGYTPERAESFLREYNDWMLQVLNIHEAIPGHYVQFVHANKSKSLVKTIFGNGAMIEGWAVYGERMMMDAGYGGSTPEMWLIWMKWNLRAVANTIIDYQIQTGDLTKEQMVTFLTREAFQSEAEATAKWRRATLSQVQLASYFSGYSEITALRDEEKARLGEKFSLRDFNNKFLSYGSAPVRYIRELMREGRPVAADEPKLPYTPGLDVSAMDRSSDPCQDFYQYSCGGWQKGNPIPADQTSWSVYRKVSEDNLAFLRAILEQAAAAKERDAVTRRIGDYYAACMDEAGAERRGAFPLRGDLDAILAAKTTRELAPLLARLQRESAGRGILFRAGSDQDLDDSEKEIPSFDQGGLGLPDRDYYFKDDAKSKDYRENYQAHVTRVLELLGDGPDAAKKSAAEILRLETALAGASLTRVERRDPYKMKHKMGPAGLDAMAPNLRWDTYLAELKAPAFETANVTAPAFFAEVSRRLDSEPLLLWKDYLRFHLANSYAPYLSASFVTEDFEFYRKYLRGAKEIQPRWKRCVRLVDEQLGEALGQAFVRRTFTPETKEATLAMVLRIEAVMERRLQERSWMSAETKQAAIAKLRVIRNKIGYPDKWRDYSAVVVERDDFAGNVRRAAAFEFARQLDKIGKPVDHGEWRMTPPTVNAYFDVQMNDINFPAGVLQPPLYDPRMDAAPNYGDTGGTVGHELTHGFDDVGRQFDARGNLKDWWTKEDAANFVERTKCVSDQYGAYIVVDDIKINSALTLGEDIADLGGEILAYEAWRDAVRDQSLEDRDGLTPDQRFFVGFAQWVCDNTRPEQLREWALTNPHSPAKYRINGVVVNMPEFAKAFSCKAGSPMTKPPGKVCSIW